MQNAKFYMGRRKDWDAFKRRFKDVIHYSLNESQFKAGWADMIKDFPAKGKARRWRKRVYAIREKWVPLFFKDQFWAGMSSTQRSEGINNFFKAFFNKHTTLRVFVAQFNVALGMRVEAETVETHEANSRPLRCRSQLDYEQIFGAVYSRKKFKAFQMELDGLGCCSAFRKHSADAGVHKYVVKDISIRCRWFDRLNGMKYKLVYIPASMEVFCECRMFEFSGILCRHAVSVMIREKVRDVPERYILDRWRRDIPRNYVKMKVVEYNAASVGPEPALYRRLRAKFEEIARLVVGNPSMAKELLIFFNQLSARAGIMKDYVAGVHVVDGGPRVGKIFRRGRSVCPIPIEEQNEMGPFPCPAGGYLDMQEAMDPVADTRGGRARKNRVGHRGRGGRTGGRRGYGSVPNEDLGEAEGNANTQASYAEGAEHGAAPTHTDTGYVPTPCYSLNTLEGSYYVPQPPQTYEGEASNYYGSQIAMSQGSAYENSHGGPPYYDPQCWWTIGDV